MENPIALFLRYWWLIVKAAFRAVLGWRYIVNQAKQNAPLLLLWAGLSAFGAYGFVPEDVSKTLQGDIASAIRPFVILLLVGLGIAFLWNLIFQPAAFYKQSSDKIENLAQDLKKEKERTNRKNDLLWHIRREEGKSFSPADKLEECKELEEHYDLSLQEKAEIAGVYFRSWKKEMNENEWKYLDKLSGDEFRASIHHLLKHALEVDNKNSKYHNEYRIYYEPEPPLFPVEHVENPEATS